MDGTIANNEHRQSWVKQKPKNWDAYNASMHLDLPIQPVIDTISTLSLIYKIIICTGRQEDKREVTLAWFRKHGLYPYITEMLMRKTKDYRDDTVVKEEMLKEIQERYEVIGVFEDRVKVVDMWRSHGLFVFDVNQSREEF